MRTPDTGGAAARLCSHLGLTAVVTTLLVVNAVPTSAKTLDLVEQVGGTMQAAAVAGDKIFTASGPRLLRLHADFSLDPDSDGPVLPDVITDVAVSGEVCAAAHEDGGFSIIGCPRNGAMDLLTVVTPSAGATKLLWLGESLLVGTAGDGLYQYELAVASRPEHVRTIESGSHIVALNADADGMHVYVLLHFGQAYEIVVYERTATDALGILVRMPLDRSAWDVAGAWPALFVSSYQDQLVAYDLSALPAVRVMYRRADALYTTALTVSGARLFVGTVTSFQVGIRVIDIADVLQPGLGGEVWLSVAGGDLFDIQVGSNAVFAALGGEGLTRWAVSENVPVGVSERFKRQLGSAGGVVVANGMLAVADSNGEAQRNQLPVGFVALLDVNEPLGRPLIEPIVTPGDAFDVWVAGSNGPLYVADGKSGMWLISILDRRRPYIMSGSRTAGIAHSLAVSGSHAFVAAGSDGLRVVYTYDPYALTEVGSVGGGAGADFYDVELRNDSQALIADAAYGLRIADISDRARPLLLGGVELSGTPLAVTSIGDFAYVAAAEWDTGGGFIHVVDVSDPGEPIVAESVPVQSPATGIVLVGESIVVLQVGAATVFDVSEPGEPAEVRQVDMPGIPRRAQVHEGRLYIAADAAGLLVYSVADLVAPSPRSPTNTRPVATEVGTSQPTPRPTQRTEETIWLPLCTNRNAAHG